MKKPRRIAFLLTLLVALTLLLCAAAEDEYTCGDYRYILLDDGTAEITRYTGNDANLTIPNHLDGYSVTAIGGTAFKGCTSLTNIIISDSVTTIGYYAFDRCPETLTFTVPRDSWAENWCRENDAMYNTY